MFFNPLGLQRLFSFARPFHIQIIKWFIDYIQKSFNCIRYYYHNNLIKLIKKTKNWISILLPKESFDSNQIVLITNLWKIFKSLPCFRLIHQRLLFCGYYTSWEILGFPRQLIILIISFTAAMCSMLLYIFLLVHLYVDHLFNGILTGCNH